MERNTGENIAEIRFENYCNSNGIFMKRLGFDEKNEPLPNFFNINQYIRNLPDYFICNTSKPNQPTALVMVKGTANIKKGEYLMLQNFIDWYSAPRCQLLYAFCFDNKLPIFKRVNEVSRLYSQSIDKQWNDGKTYRNLKLIANNGDI
jgi:hypothetical protein